MQANEDENKANRHTTLLGLGLLMAMAGGVFGALLVEVEAMRPVTGDIVSFEPGQHVPASLVGPVSASLTTGGSCALDPQAMAQGGGSLVVEGTLGEHRLSVHWAGGRSSASSDCGASANLVLTEDTLDALAAAAGGYGVVHKSLALSSIPVTATI